MADIVELKRMLAARAQTVAEHLLPAGKREGHEWRAGSVGGDAGKSLSVHLDGTKAGVWADFSADGSGDLIDLWMAVRRVDLATALDDIRAWLGVERPTLHRPIQPSWKRPPKPKCGSPEGRAMAYLTEERNLSRDILAAYKIGEDEGGNIIFPFLLPDGTLALAKRRSAVDGARTIPTATDCEPILFGWQTIPPDARTVVLTEGEIDALSWAEYGYAAMSIPFGGGGGGKQRWIESEFDRMGRFERIYLAMDMDPVGDEAALEIANRLGRHRCVRVKMPRKDGNACLVEGIPKAEMDAAIVGATWFDVGGLRRTIEFTDEVLALFFPRDGERVGYSTPYRRLGDKLLFRPGEVTIWTGDTGAGKTQILSHCVIDWVEQRSRICLSSLEMVPKETLKRMCKQVIGSDTPTGASVVASLQWLNGGSQPSDADETNGALFVYALTGKQKIEEMLQVFDYARSRYGCDQFVIDSLMRLGIAGDDYNSQEAVMFRIVEWAMSSSTHVHLVAHAKKGERDRGSPSTEDIKGAMEIGANAFNIVSVWRDRKLEDKITKLKDGTEVEQATAAELRKSTPGVVLNIAKQRNGDFEGKIGLWFDQGTYRYRSRDDEATWKRNYLPENWKEAA